VRENIIYEYTYLIIKKTQCHHCGLIGKLRKVHLTTNKHLKQVRKFGRLEKGCEKKRWNKTLKEA